MLLADQLASEHPDGVLLYGAENAAALFPTEESPYVVHRSTMDGSVGQPGTVIELLGGLLRRGAFRPDLTFLCGCGPLPMLDALSRFAEENGMPVQVSMETMFGCGTGLCAGCAVPLRPRSGEAASGFERYAFACTDGPVFDGARIDWPEVVP
jgi:dihydroorotate dehydrogenase electron transfer subunit